MPAKKTPMRLCTGCGERKPKKEMIRVVRTPQGEFLIDRTEKKSGRGAYVCNDVECLVKCRKSRKLEKSFHCAIPSEIYDKLEEEFHVGE